VLNWGPRINYSRAYDYAGVLQDEERGMGLSAQFARNINVGGNYSREMERYVGIDFSKHRWGLNANINTSRRFGINLNVNGGDGIRYDEDDPALGKELRFNTNFNVRPFSRLSSSFMINTSRLRHARTGEPYHDVKVYRSVTSFQFTDRLTLRSIIERNSEDKTISANILGAYRVNAGTAFFIGYDDHYQQGDAIEDGALFDTRDLKRTNRAIFTKLQYLFRL
jgi:hypothetical protein